MVKLSRRRSRGGRTRRNREDKNRHDYSNSKEFQFDESNDANTDKESCYAILCAEKSRPIKNRILFRKFFVAKSYDTEIIYDTVSFTDAVNNCPKDHMIFDSDGIKVFPAPHRKTTSGHEYIIRKNRFDKVLSSHRELQDAINACPNGYFVYDSDGHKVY